MHFAEVGADVTVSRSDSPHTTSRACHIRATFARMPTMLSRSAFAVACVAAALTGARVSARASGAFGASYAVGTEDAALAPHLGDDELVLRVSQEPAPADAGSRRGQFTCTGEGRTWHRQAQARGSRVVLGQINIREPNPARRAVRLPLPYELSAALEDFSRMMLGMPGWSVRGVQDLRPLRAHEVGVYREEGRGGKEPMAPATPPAGVSNGAQRVGDERAQENGGDGKSRRVTRTVAFARYARHYF